MPKENPKKNGEGGEASKTDRVIVPSTVFAERRKNIRGKTRSDVDASTPPEVLNDGDKDTKSGDVTHISQSSSSSSILMQTTFENLSQQFSIDKKLILEFFRALQIPYEDLNKNSVSAQYGKALQELISGNFSKIFSKNVNISEEIIKAIIRRLPPNNSIKESFANLLKEDT